MLAVKPDRRHRPALMLPKQILKPKKQNESELVTTPSASSERNRITGFVQD